MLATETKTYSKSPEIFLSETFNRNIDELAISSQKNTYSANIQSKEMSNYVSKSYEINAGSICENYFETAYSEEEAEFINDYAASFKNGVILIMTDTMTEEDVLYFTENMKNKLKFIIYYQGDASQYRINSTKGLTFIRTFSFKAAINEAYKQAKSSQAILFPKVDPNFDFFKYIDNLN